MPLATHNSRKYGKSGIRERIRYRNDACAFLLCESSTTFLVNAKLRTPSCTKRNTAAEPDPREHARRALRRRLVPDAAGRLWPTLLREQLAVQPTFPDFIGPTLVVAAGRASFARNALGGLLEACRAVPLEHFSPDGTCSTADELARWRRCASADGKRPAEALPREGRAQEFDWARTELPPIDMGQVGAAAAAGALRSCAGARLRERARGGGALSGESTSGGAGGDKGAGKRRREGVALDRDANTGGRTDDLITRRLWFNLAPCTRACH